MPATAPPDHDAALGALAELRRHLAAMPYRNTPSSPDTTAADTADDLLDALGRLIETHRIYSDPARNPHGFCLDTLAQLDADDYDPGALAGDAAAATLRRGSAVNPDTGGWRDDEFAR